MDLDGRHKARGEQELARCLRRNRVRICAKHRHTVVWRRMSCGRTTKHICMRPWKGSLDETIVDFACSEQGLEEEQIGRTRSAGKKCEVDVLATSTFVACPALARRVTTNGSRNGLIHPPICCTYRRRWTKQAESCCEATLSSPRPRCANAVQCRPFE